MKDFFSKCDQIRRTLRKKSLIENFQFFHSIRFLLREWNVDHDPDTILRSHSYIMVFFVY